jgi:hypothetical protein
MLLLMAIENTLDLSTWAIAISQGRWHLAKL